MVLNPGSEKVKAIARIIKIRKKQQKLLESINIRSGMPVRKARERAAETIERIEPLMNTRAQ